MSTEIDIQYVEETYQRMSDEELIRIATQDAYGLTSEALEVVKAEIRRRGLDSSIIKSVEAQNKELTLEQIDAYCDIVSKLGCPVCGSTAQRLNATLTSEVMSFIFFTQSKKKIKVGCGHCLDKANENALIKSAVLGWWGLPWGILRTPGAIATNIKSKRTNHAPDHNNYLRSFVVNKIGELETHKNDIEKLEQLLVRYNSL